MNFQSSLILAAAAALISSASATITMDWVTIGNVNNAADSLTGYGAVDHAYQIGKYEVTNAQYGEFLNAKGQTNANGIYNASMSSYGITQSGNSGSYTYSVTGALANRPVVQVSWFDAARFANWLGNGQGSADTETGSYNLMDATTGIIMVNPGAKAWIPTEDEWYKAAYYNPSTTSYSLYPNGQNTITTADANYSTSASKNVGSYSADSSSYGTFDQGGNVWEWNDAVISGSLRGKRGGCWNNFNHLDDVGLMSTSRFAGSDPTTENSLAGSIAGFRLASASVPEPTSILMTMFAGAVMLIRRKR
jgi:sulfatase modifying factor 1